MPRTNRFAEGKLGEALDALVNSTEHTESLEVGGRVLRVCRLLEWNPGGDSVHEMAHHELDILAREQCMGEAVELVRAQLVRRTHAPGTLWTD